MMNRYKTGLFGFQGEFFKIKDLFDFLALGEARGDLIDTVYLDPPTEVSVYGNIYHASKYRDYAISDDIHSIVHKLYPYYKKDPLVIDRLRELLERMKEINN